MRWRSVNKRAPRTSGFTLLEVLISMFLLVVISFATYQATTETFKLRDVLSTEGEFYNSIRLAVSVLQRDLENAYSPIAIRPELMRPGLTTGNEMPQQVPVEPPPAGTGLNREMTTSDFFSGEIDKYGIRATRLFGSSDKLLWVSTSNTRIYKDSPEADFLKLRYTLERETDPEFEQGTSMLVRSASPNAFIYNEDRDEQVKRYPLLHGIRKLKFRYYRKDKDQWSDSWDSESSDTKELFPDIVELQIEVSAPKGLTYEGRYQIRTEVPIYGIPSTL